MGTIGVKEALGGSWAFNFIGWLVLFLPSTVLVIAQESATPFPQFGYVLLSAVVQHLLAGIIALPAIAYLRGGARRLSIGTSFAIWTAMGLARGLVGGLLASTFASADPDFANRIIVWLLVSWVWMPLFTYSASQGQRRRMLLNDLDDAVARRERAHQLRERTTDDIRAELLHVIQTVIMEAIDDIRASLASARLSLDPDQFRQVGDRLASVSRRVGSAVERLGASEVEETVLVVRAGAPLRAALTFEHRRPWLSSALSTTVLGAVVAPLGVHLEGWPFLVEFGIAMLVATVALAIGTRIVPPDLESIRRQIAWVVGRYGTAGLAAALVMAIASWDDLDSFTAVFVVVLPCGVSFSAFIVSGAFGLTSANREAVQSLAEIEADRKSLEDSAAEEENRVRGQLAELLHGPVLGRLAACAMALNFHAAEVGSVATAHTEQLAAAVTEHLDAAMADLSDLIR